MPDNTRGKQITQRTWALIWLCCAIVALLLLASGLAGITFRPGHLYDFGALLMPTGAPGQPTTVPLRQPSWLSLLMMLIVLATLIYTVINLIISRKFRRQVLIRTLSILITTLLFYLVMSALRSNLSPTDRAPAAPGAAPAPTQASEPFPAFVANPAPWLTIAVSAILAALLIAGILFLWRRMRVPQPPLARLADEAQAALADLEAGGDLKDTVLRCYAEMSRILSEQRGLARPQDMTPREFARQLAAAGLRDEHIQQLTRVFERVRYGARPAGEREERAAVACLTAIVQTYGRAP